MLCIVIGRMIYVSKTLAMNLLLMHIETAGRNHEEAPFEIQIMYACTVSIKLIQGFIRLYCHQHYILEKKKYILVLSEG